MEELTRRDRDMAALLAGWFLGLSGTNRHQFSDHEKAMFLRASDLFARLIGLEESAEIGDEGGPAR